MYKVNLCNCDTSTLPRISNEECEELLKKSADGDGAARERLVMANIRLVLSIVQRFKGKACSDDLFQVGIVGLMKALPSFLTNCGAGSSKAPSRKKGIFPTCTLRARL